MNTTLLTAGLACVIAGIVGGGLKAWGIEIPALKSWTRQAILICFGGVLIMLAQPPSAETKHPTAASSSPSVTSDSPAPSSKEPIDSDEVVASNNPPSKKWSGTYTNIKFAGKAADDHASDVARMDMQIWNPPDQGNGTVHLKLTSFPNGKEVDCEIKWDLKLYATDQEKYLDYTFDNRLVYKEDHCFQFGLIPIRGSGRVTAYNDIFDNALFLTGPFQALGMFKKQHP